MNNALASLTEIQSLANLNQSVCNLFNQDIKFTEELLNRIKSNIKRFMGLDYHPPIESVLVNEGSSFFCKIPKNGLEVVTVRSSDNYRQMFDLEMSVTEVCIVATAISMEQFMVELDQGYMQEHIDQHDQLLSCYRELVAVAIQCYDKEIIVSAI